MERRKYELYYDLRDVEEAYLADFSIVLTENEDGPLGFSYPPGIVVSANCRAHGADVHLTWEQAREVRDTLTRLLREAGQE